MRTALVTLGAVMLLVGTAHAQTTNDTDPTLNETDMDASAPPADDAYLNDTSTNDTSSASDPQADPTLSESDFDTSAPTADTSYLDDAQAQSDASGAAAVSTTPATAKTPGVGIVAALGVLGLAALALRRR